MKNYYYFFISTIRDKGLADNLGGRSRAVAVASHDDVQTIKRLVTLHTLSIHVSLGYHISDFAQLTDASNDTTTIIAILGNGKCPLAAAIAPQSVSLSGWGDNLLVVEACDKLHILGILSLGHTK